MRRKDAEQMKEYRGTDAAASAEHRTTESGYRPAYRVVFEDHEGNPISSKRYHVLERIEAPTIIKPDDKHYRYSFEKWTPEIEEYASHDVVYRPVFRRHRKVYRTTWILAAAALLVSFGYAVWMLREERSTEEAQQAPAAAEFVQDSLSGDGSLLEQAAPEAGEQNANSLEEETKADPSEQSALYLEAVELYGAGEYVKAARAFLALGDYQDSAAWACQLWDAIAGRNTIAAGFGSHVAAHADGTVQTTSSTQPDWTNIVAVEAGLFYEVGLKADGTVVLTDPSLLESSDIADWTGIAAIGAGCFHVIGVRMDGTVTAVGDNQYGQCDVDEWTDVVAVSGGWWHTLGLRSDGTVLAAGQNSYGSCDVSDWNHIVAIAAGDGYSVGLKADGTVVAAGQENPSEAYILDLEMEPTDIAATELEKILNERDVSDLVKDWTDIVAIASGKSHIVGLRADGTVVAAGENFSGRCDVSDWTDIVAISAGGLYTIGLKSDGTLVAAGEIDRLGDLAAWNSIRIPNRSLYGLDALMQETAAS